MSRFIALSLSLLAFAASAQAAAAKPGFVPVCSRTPAVRLSLEALTKKICGEITTDDLAALKRVAVDHLNIPSFKAGDFTGLVNLEILNIRSNPFTTLPEGLLADLTQLKTLVLIQVGLVQVPADLLDYAPELENLHIHKNPQLVALPEAVWQKLGENKHWVEIDFDKSFASANPGRLEGLFPGKVGSPLILH